MILKKLTTKAHTKLNYPVLARVKAHHDWDILTCGPLKYNQNILDSSLVHHRIYQLGKFEVARSNGLGGVTFTRNVTDAQMDNGPTLVQN